MTTLREAAEQALESMEAVTVLGYMTDAQYVRLNQSIDALRAALAEPDWSVTGASMMDAEPRDPPSEEYLRQKIADWKKAHGDKGER